MIEPLKLEDIDVIKPTTIILKDDYSGELKIEFYEDEIYITNENKSWTIVDEAKKNFEQTVNPDKRIWKYTKSHISWFFKKLSGLFE